ncbi:DUF4186 family protein [Lyngbya sp. CCY1209]|uniref:DUF4186 family protein n=1 Tax=Lyngbya sp. CCY1209 TaxID=2886103 RepID=UPI002D202463|nr:DUF4186 family protein [Lyngbya sp. CCY1209]MEB3885517.1 DUF4186 domain-containing protein [Lyngbya sp. CCY1209]
MSKKRSLKDRIKSLESEKKITCTSSDCKNGLHCFKPDLRKKVNNSAGKCRSCQVDAPFDWERIHKCDSGDIEYIVAALKNELIRKHYWTNEIPEKVQNYARRKGTVKMKEAIEKRIRKYIAPPEGKYDGRQTPGETSNQPNAVHFAQHGTASCCRKCAEYWYGIPRDRHMTEAEIDYLTKLGMRYIGERFPLLTEGGEYIPPIRKKKSKKSEDRSNDD